MSTALALALAPKSDQLNADDLIVGPITVQITSVNVTPTPGGQQPIAVGISGGYKPWKPCKTMGRLLVMAWGDDEQAWIGRWVTLYRDPTVTWGSEAAGGIRVSHLSHIKGPFTATLTATKGKKTKWHVAVVVQPNAEPAITDAKLKGWCADAVNARGWTREEVSALLGGPLASVPADARADIVAALKGPPPRQEGAPDGEAEPDGDPQGEPDGQST